VPVAGSLAIGTADGRQDTTAHTEMSSTC
jgi:hypothetical protein